MKIEAKYDDYGIERTLKFFTLKVGDGYEMFVKTSNVVQQFVGRVKENGSDIFIALMYIKQNIKTANDVRFVQSA